MKMNPTQKGGVTMLNQSPTPNQVKGDEKFPLIEWMIVVTCLGIMLAIAVPNFLAQ
jgi:Tfp pilus assembly protein FimT